MGIKHGEALHTILVVEDEALIGLDLQLLLQEMGFRVIGPAASGAAALALAAAEKPDLALMDIRIQGPVNGIETAARLGRISGVPLVFLTSHSDASTMAKAIHTRPLGYLTKPFETQALRPVVEAALQQAAGHCRSPVAHNVMFLTPHVAPHLRNG